MSDNPRKVLKIKNDNDSYTIKMYDGTTYGSYSEKELKNQLKKLNATDSEIKKVLSLSKNQQASINTKKVNKSDIDKNLIKLGDMEKAFTVNSINYYGKYDDKEGLYSAVPDSDDGFTVIVNGEDVYSKKYNNKNDAKNAVEILTSSKNFKEDALNRGFLLSNVNDLPENLKELTKRIIVELKSLSEDDSLSESVNSDAEYLADQMIKNHIISKKDKKSVVSHLMSSVGEYDSDNDDDDLNTGSDYYPKPARIRDLIPGSLFYTMKPLVYHPHQEGVLLKVIDISKDKSDKDSVGTSGLPDDHYTLSVVRYPHYDYDLWDHVSGNEDIYLASRDSVEGIKGLSRDHVTIYNDNPSALKVGMNYISKEFPNQVKRVNLVVEKRDPIQRDPMLDYDLANIEPRDDSDSKYVIVNYKIVESDLRSEIGEEGTDVFSTAQTISIRDNTTKSEGYEDIYYMSGTEAEARDNYSVKDRTAVMNRHKYTDYTKNERESREQQYPSKSDNSNVNYFNPEGSSYNSGKSGIHVVSDGKKLKDTAGDKYTRVAISAPKSSYKMRVPLTSRFNPVVNLNINSIKNKYKLP